VIEYFVPFPETRRVDTELASLQQNFIMTSVTLMKSQSSGTWPLRFCFWVQCATQPQPSLPALPVSGMFLSFRQALVQHGFSQAGITRFLHAWLHHTGT